MAKPSQPGSSATEEEPSFPRGGASSITPLKRRQIRADAQADAERDFSAGISAGDPASNKRRKKSGKAAGQVQVLVTAASTVEPVSSCVRSNSIPKAHCYFDSTLDTSSATQGIETSFLARELAHGKTPAFVELLKFKVGLLAWCTPFAASAPHKSNNLIHAMQTCNVRARVWGVVSDVTHHGIAVSLPDGLKGHVSVEEVQPYCVKSWQSYACPLATPSCS